MSRQEAELLGKRHGIYDVSGLAALLGVPVCEIDAAVNRLHLRPVFAARGEVRLFDAAAMRQVADALEPDEKVTSRLEAVRVPLSRRRGG